MARKRTARTVSDPRVLRGIAHPLRNRILSELYATGPMRAADVAAALGVPANQASFHLRQLAKYGLVAEAPEEARDGRDRVWKVAIDNGVSFNFREVEAAPGGRAVGNVLRRNIEQRAHHTIDAALNRPEDESTDDIHVMLSDSAIRLTKDEAVEFASDLTAFFDTWREKTMGRGDGRQTYSLLQVLQPYPSTLEEPEDS